jgi:hypothetical protein
MQTYQTNLPRALLGIGVGIIAGASLTALWSLNGASYEDLAGPEIYSYAVVVWVYAAVFWTAGLLLVACLPWAVLHWLGVRSWWGAAVFGAILTFAVSLGLLTHGFGLNPPGSFSSSDSGGPEWINGHITPHGWANAARFAAVLAAAGALVGLAIWRTAYRRDRIAIDANVNRVYSPKENS